jgi:hypothetical protein
MRATFSSQFAEDTWGSVLPGLFGGPGTAMEMLHRVELRVVVDTADHHEAVLGEEGRRLFGPARRVHADLVGEG